MWESIAVIALCVALVAIAYREGKRKRAWEDYQAILRAQDRERALEAKETRLKAELFSLQLSNDVLRQQIEKVNA